MKRCRALEERLRLGRATTGHTERNIPNVWTGVPSVSCLSVALPFSPPRALFSYVCLFGFLFLRGFLL